MYAYMKPCGCRTAPHIVADLEGAQFIKMIINNGLQGEATSRYLRSDTYLYTLTLQQDWRINDAFTMLRKATTTSHTSTNCRDCSTASCGAASD